VLAWCRAQLPERPMREEIHDHLTLMATIAHLPGDRVVMLVGKSIAMLHYVAMHCSGKINNNYMPPQPQAAVYANTGMVGNDVLEYYYATIMTVAEAREQYGNLARCNRCKTLLRDHA